MSEFAKSMRRNWRGGRASPSIYVLIVFILGLAIGLNSAMFSVLYDVLLRPFPYASPDELMSVEEFSKEAYTNIAVPTLRDFERHGQTISELSWYEEAPLNARIGNHVFPILNIRSNANLFAMLGVAPIEGRTFSRTDSQADLEKSAVISFQLWQSIFHADPDVLAKSLLIDGKPYSVIGVMPSLFSFPADFVGRDEEVVWTVLPGDVGQDRSSSTVTALARIRRGFSSSQAIAELNTIQARLATQYANPQLKDRVSLRPYRDFLVEKARPATIALQIAVLLVWLVACVNVMSIRLTHSLSRLRDGAIKLSLGATRASLFREDLYDNISLCALGTVLGSIFGIAAIKIIQPYLSGVLPKAPHVSMEWSLVGLLAVLTVLSAALITVGQAFGISDVSLESVLRDGTASSGYSPWLRKARNALVVGQLAVTFLLIVAAAILLRNVYALRHQPIGFNADHLVKAGFLVPPGVQSAEDVRDSLYNPLLQRLRALPGVRSAALTSGVPLQSTFSLTTSFDIPGEADEPAQRRQAVLRVVSPDIYDTLGVPIIKGRPLLASDKGDEIVAVINGTLARQHFRGVDPIDKTISIDSKPTSPFAHIRVVGVMEDTRQQSMDSPIVPEINLSYLQIPFDSSYYPVLLAYEMEVVVRTDAATSVFVPTIRDIVSSVNQDIVLIDLESMQASIDQSELNKTLAARLLILFGLSALFIALSGVYGTMAFSVGFRRREIAIRLALGAVKSDIVRIVLREGLTLIISGLLLGVALSVVVAHVAGSFLYGLATHDFLSYAVVCGSLVVVGTAACYVPALQAGRNDPIQILRLD